MITKEPLNSPTTIISPGERSWLPSLRWGAIFGGTIAAIGIHILLTALGVGAGLAAFEPATDENPVAHFSIGAAVVWSVCALVALYFGGVVAGRFSHSLHSGFVHGILVWCLALIISILALSAGTGMILGGALKILGEGIGIGGKAVAAGLGDLGKEGLQRSGDQLRSFIDETIPTNAPPRDSIRAKREIGFALTKLFGPGGNADASENRAAAVKALTTYAGMNEADATKTVDEWADSYKKLKAELDRLKTEAEEKARQVADRAAENLSKAALLSFFALLVGLLVTALGGSCGARSAVRAMESAPGTVK